MGQYDWIIGVVLITVGSIGNNLGNNLMSLGHTEEKNMKAELIKQASKDCVSSDIENTKGMTPEESKDTLNETTISKNDDKEIPNNDKSNEKDDNKTDEKPKKSWWLSGTIIFVLGALFTFAAFGFGAQSLLAAMESIQFISNVFFVYFVHGQKVTTRMIISTLCIVAGNILVVIFSSHAAQNLKSADINYLYLNNLAYQIYAILAFLTFLANFFVFRHYYHSRVTLQLPPLWKHSFIEPLSYTIYSTILGTQAVLQSKTLAMLLKETFSNENQFLQPTVYIVLFVWLFFVSFWLNRLNRALDLFPPLFIIPVMQVFFVFFAILSGGIFFEEFIGFSAAQYTGFVIGVCLIFIGVYGLAPPEAEVFSPEITSFSEPIRPKTLSTRFLQGEIFFQIPPNLPASSLVVDDTIDIIELTPHWPKVVVRTLGTLGALTVHSDTIPVSSDDHTEPANGSLSLSLPHNTSTNNVYMQEGSLDV